MMRKRRDDAIKDQHAFIILYDITDSKSFKSINDAYQTIFQEFSYTGQDPPRVLVGTNSDRAAERQIDYSEVEQIADCFNSPYIEASAKTGQNVVEAIDLLILELLKRE